jgi:hypothetical protein
MSVESSPGLGKTALGFAVFGEQADKAAVYSQSLLVISAV